MTDNLIKIFLTLSCIALAISLIRRPRPLPPVLVSDNGIVPPGLLSGTSAENEQVTTQAYNIRPIIAKVQANALEARDTSAPTSDEVADSVSNLLNHIMAPNVLWRYLSHDKRDSIREIDGMLVIRFTRSKHREMASLLTRLDAALSK